MAIFRRVKSFFQTGQSQKGRAEAALNRRLNELKAETTGPKPINPGPTATETRLTKLADLARDARLRVQEGANAAISTIPTGEVIETPADDVEAFLYFHQVEYVESSNVVSIKYQHEQEFLIVEYKDGSFYEYAPVSLQMAEDFITAPSKGKWVWDHLRVRGTVFGYKVPYQLAKFGGTGKVVGKALPRPKGGRRTGAFVTPSEMLDVQLGRRVGPDKPRPPI